MNHWPIILLFYQVNAAWKSAQNIINTFTAIDNLSRFNNSCLISPVSTLVDLIFQSHSFSFNQLCDPSLLAGNLYRSFSISSWHYPIHSLLCFHCDIITRVYPYAQRESGLSLAAVYKESFICEFVYVWQFILLSATWHLGKEI